MLSVGYLGMKEFVLMIIRVKSEEAPQVYLQGWMK